MRWDVGSLFLPRRGAVRCLVWRLKSLACFFFCSLWNIHQNVFWSGVAEILHFFRHQTCDICCLWFSPQSISGTRTVSFQLPEKSWKYFCVVRWISRLYSLQCSPWIPRVPFLRLLLAHAFYLCQENMKLNVFWPSHSTLCPWRCPLSFWKIAEHRSSIQYQEVLEILKSVGKKKVFYESFLCWFRSFYVVNQKKPTPFYRPSLLFQSWICDWSSLRHLLLP